MMRPADRGESGAIGINGRETHGRGEGAYLGRWIVTLEPPGGNDFWGLCRKFKVAASRGFFDMGGKTDSTIGHGPCERRVVTVRESRHRCATPTSLGIIGQKTRKDSGPDSRGHHKMARLNNRGLVRENRQQCDRARVKRRKEVVR